MKSNSINKALDLYYEIVSVDFFPTPWSYGPLIGGLLKAGRSEEAMNIFEEMPDYQSSMQAQLCYL